MSKDTLDRLRQVASEMQARKAPAKPSFTRKIHEAHREVGAMPKTQVALGVAKTLKKSGT